LLPIADRGPHRRHNPLRDVALHRKRVVQGAVVSLRPEVRLRHRVNQLHRDAETVPDHLHAALHEAADGQLVTDLTQPFRRPRIAHYRGPADDLQRRYLGKEDLTGSK